MSSHYLKQVTKVFSIDKIFQSRECMNQIFEILPTLEPEIALKAFQQMIRYGCNPEVLNVDVTYYLIAFQQAKRHGNFAPDLDGYLPENLTPS